jgi:hypothetical protein
MSEYPPLLSTFTFPLNVKYNQVHVKVKLNERRYKEKKIYENPLSPIRGFYWEEVL